MVNIQVKSEASKAKWMLEMATNSNFRLNLLTFSEVLGVQEGNNFGRDLIFMDKSFITRTLRTDNTFYKEAFKALSILELMKGIPTREDWDNENIFHNPLVLGKTGKTLKVTDHFRKNKIFKLGQLLEEKAKAARGIVHDRFQVSLLKNITLKMGPFEVGAVKEDWIFFANATDTKISCITQKDIYEDTILRKSGDHKYQTKWAKRFNIIILWDAVWNSVHSSLHSNYIWEQLHLNFYSQSSPNKWHDTLDFCPLCHEIPTDIFHIMLNCKFTNTLWEDLQSLLYRLQSKRINDEEKALGLINIKSSPGILLRNWVTFKLREQILKFEKIAYHSGGVNINSFKVDFNHSMASEVKHIILRYTNEGSVTKIDKLIAYRGVLCKKDSKGYYVTNPIFPL